MIETDTVNRTLCTFIIIIYLFFVGNMVYSHSLQFETNPRPTKVFIILISKRWPNGSLHYKHIQAFVLSSSSIIYKLIKTNHSYNP